VKIIWVESYESSTHEPDAPLGKTDQGLTTLEELIAWIKRLLNQRSVFIHQLEVQTNTYNSDIVAELIRDINPRIVAWKYVISCNDEDRDAVLFALQSLIAPM